MTTVPVRQQPWEWRWIQAALPLTSLYSNTRVEINRATRIANISLFSGAHTHTDTHTHTHTHTHYSTDISLKQ